MEARAFVNSEGKAVIKCPHCEKGKATPVAQFKGRKSTIKIKCSCGETFTLRLEFRMKYRKPVNLVGRYVNHSQKKAEGDIYVRDLSMTGMKFTTVGPNTLKLGDSLTLDFTLTDQRQGSLVGSDLTREALVKYIDRHFIGCEFVKNADDPSDQRLGFFLLP